MKTIVFILLIAGLGAIWELERQTAGELREHVETLRKENAGLKSLRSERRHLQRLQDDAERQAGLQREPASREKSEQRNQAPTFALGEWLPPAAWENCGRDTPAATVETALWAAEGGDIATLNSLLLLDPSARKTAESALSKIPASSRSLYTSAGELVAAFATKSIPLGDAQLVWQHQSTPDDSVIGLFLKNPSGSAASTITKTVYLALHRTDEDGWRLVVPKTAVEKMARELAAP